MNILPFIDKVLEDKHYPFSHMDLKNPVIFNQIYNDFVNCFMHLVEFLPFIYFLFKDLLFHVLADVEKKLEK